MPGWVTCGERDPTSRQPAAGEQTLAFLVICRARRIVASGSIMSRRSLTNVIVNECHSLRSGSACQSEPWPRSDSVSARPIPLWLVQFDLSIN